MQNFIHLLELAKGRDETAVFILIIFSTFLFSLLTKKLFSNLLIAILQKVLTRSKFSSDSSNLKPASKSIGMIFVITLTYAATVIFTHLLSDNASRFALLLLISKKVYRVLIIFSVTVLLYSLIPFFIGVFKKVGKKSSDSSNQFVDLFLEKAAKFIVIAIGGIAILGELGVNVNGLITGIGLGGLTFALAAQDTAANIFGGLVIISDRPFLVGDWISTDELEGVVEDISFRSTRIRTFDDALVIVPNSKLSSVAITNWAKMTKRRVNFKVCISYATSEDQLKNILFELKEKLSENPLVFKDSLIVRLDELSMQGINIRIIFYADVTTLSDLKNLQEQINLEILRIMNQHQALFISAGVPAPAPK